LYQSIIVPAARLGLQAGVLPEGRT
jgi:hypothetical protein